MELAKPVHAEQMAYAQEVAEAMAYWMKERGGVGIAAPQIGVSLQMMITSASTTFILKLISPCCLPSRLLMLTVNAE